MKDKIGDWIENVLSDRVDFFQDFMASLEKEFPTLHSKIEQAIWEFAEVSVNENLNEQAERKNERTP